MQIEKNVPIPDDIRGPKSKYPFKEMEVGDSVFVEGERSDGGAYRAATATARRYDMKFSARSRDGGVRIWRIQ